MDFKEALAIQKDQPGCADVHVSTTDTGKSPKGKKSPFTITAKIEKVDEERRLVYGWASVISEAGQDVIDSQGDIISTDELVKAAHKFMAEQRNAGDLHGDYGSQIGTIVESLVLTPEVQKALGVDLGKVGWFICAKVAHDGVWAKVKDGTYAAFSIGGSAVREPV